VTGRVIRGPDCLAEGAAWLLQADPRLAPALAQPLPLRLKPHGFAELLAAIVSQQVSTASAAAIWGRLQAAELTTPQAVTTASEDDLRAVGLSRPKARYARALAGAGIDFAALEGMATAQVVGTLTAVPGIGVWTAEIYAMFSLGHADVLPAGDLALQEGARMLLGLEARPGEKALRQIAAPWAPWRAVAARALWAYYAQAKWREGVR
jgi:DNA-3-methyladenine glycosylase II